MNWLHSFEAAARLGNMTLAASEVGLTQAAMSQQIKALEIRLGRQLFVREPRGVSLTAAGTRLYAEIAPSLDQIGNALKRYATPRRNRLRLLCNTSLATRWLNDLLPKFQRMHPDILLELRTALWPPDRLGYDADVEIFLGFGVRPPRAEFLVQSPFVAVAAPEIAARVVSQDQGIPLIRISGLSHVFDTWLSRKENKKIKFVDVAETDSNHGALTMAEAGLGLTLCSSFLAKQSIHEGRLQVLTDAKVAPDVAYWLQLKDVTKPAAILFRDWIMATLS
ncbi:LysR substrate-binding domain-containing protein [Roseovarius aestuarii]|nr:LysR substrate-binding domain-containing protein [Roseovarius aestuarii]